MTAFHVLFLTVFIGGLVLAVFTMLHGVEHARANRSRAPSPFFNLQAVAAFAVGFGAVGYPVASRTRLSPLAVLVLAICGGALTISGMITLLARWALRGAQTTRPGQDDEIQGQLAVVTESIGATDAGQISFQRLGQTVQVAARGLTETPLPTGTEVVIDRVENGVAFVEEWAVVEQRL